MPLWDKVKQELDRAGQVAQDAIDEGRLRLELQRAQRLADRAAQVLGYAVHRARATGTPLGDAEVGRHSAKLAEYEADVARLEAQLKGLADRWRGDGRRGGSADPGSGSGGAPTGSPDPIDPSPPPPASATTPPPPETAAAPPAAEASTTPRIDDDPWRPAA